MASFSMEMPTELPPDEDRRVALEAVWWTGISIATIFIILRFWARILKRSLGLDDIFMAICYVFFLAEAIIVTYVGETGRTRHMLYLGGLPEINSTIMFYIIILDIGIFVTGLGKIAIGITILRIFGNTLRWQRWTVWTVMALTIITCIIDFCISTFLCGNPVLTWTVEAQAQAHCISSDVQSGINTFSNSIQVMADFAFSVLPMAIVWGLRMPQRRKISLVVALGLTLITGVAGTVKTVYAATMNELDLSWAIFPGLICFAVEAMLIIVCGSMPSLHPLYERYIKQRGLGYRSQDTPQFGRRTYVNSADQFLSEQPWPRSKKRFLSRARDDSLLTTLNNADDPQVGRLPDNFELSPLDHSLLQPQTLAIATLHDPKSWQDGGIRVFEEVDVTSRAKPHVISKDRG